MKKIGLLIVFFALILNASCNETPKNNHECTEFEWVLEEEDKPCLERAFYDLVCTECGEVKEVEERVRPHEFEVIEHDDVFCGHEGHTTYRCIACDHTYTEYDRSTDHPDFYYEVLYEPTEKYAGTKEKKCTRCDEVLKTFDYVDNGYDTHGKLSVNGTDLVDQNGEKFQLIGLSTHGLQWCKPFINLETFENLRNEFGINVIRLSLYPEEGGYSTCTEQEKEILYDEVRRGIEYCTKIGIYALLDWHMLGDNFHTKDAMEYFKRIGEEFKGYDNLLYEICNEPYGDYMSTEACRQYANYVIPVIRDFTDGVVIVGGPHWSAELSGWLNKPLDYDNIMYTYHFYANGATNHTILKYYYDRGLPIFVTEHGGMESTGDGPLLMSSINNWWNTMDNLNISYVAWNISNTRGSASIFKYNSSEYTNVSDSNLKEWGVVYKKHVRLRVGLDKK